MPKPPIWIDTDLLIHMYDGDTGMMSGFAKFHADGHQLLITKGTELEFLHGAGAPESRLIPRQNLLKRLGITVDEMANQVPMTNLRAWRDAAMNGGLPGGDANNMAQIKASAQVRGIKDPIFYTGNKKDVLKMRQTGVEVVRWEPGTPRPEPPMPKGPPGPGSGSGGNSGSGSGSGSGAGSGGGATGGASMGSKVTGFISRRLSNWKVGIKAGLEGVFTPEGIAAAMPDLVLAISDRVAASAAIKNIEVTFIKSGFGRGLCAAVMGWIEDEVESECMNRVDAFRVEGMEDPAGILKLDFILKLAENFENYGVGVGFLWSKEQPQSWKEQFKSDSKELLKKFNYYWPTSSPTPSFFFTYEFIDHMAYFMRHRTDAIVEPALRFHDSYSQTEAWWKRGG